MRDRKYVAETTNTGRYQTSHGSNIRIVTIELWMWPPMAGPDSTAVGLLADSGGFKMPLPASDQYYCHSQLATTTKEEALQDYCARQD